MRVNWGPPINGYIMAVSSNIYIYIYIIYIYVCVNFNATCQVSFDCCQGWHDGVPFTAIAISVAQGHETARRLGKRRGAAPLCGLVWTPFGISFWSTFPFGIHSTSLGHFDLQPRGRGLTGCYRCEGSHSSHTGSGACGLVLPFWA